MNQPITNNNGAINVKEAKRQLDFFDGANSQYLFQCINDKVKGQALESFYGTIEEHFASLEEWNNKGYGVFICVNRLLAGTVRREETVTGIRFLAFDTDEKSKEAGSSTLPTYRDKPSLVIKSANGYHTYYRLEETEEERKNTTPLSDEAVDSFKDTARRLIRSYACNGADENAGNIHQLLRLAGFYHHKAEPFLITIHSESTWTYSRADLMTGLPPLKEEETASYKRKHKGSNKTIVGGKADPAEYVERNKPFEIVSLATRVEIAKAYLASAPITKNGNCEGEKTLLIMCGILKDECGLLPDMSYTEIAELILKVYNPRLKGKELYSEEKWSLGEVYKKVVEAKEQEYGKRLWDVLAETTRQTRAEKAKERVLSVSVASNPLQTTLPLPTPNVLQPEANTESNQELKDFLSSTGGSLTEEEFRKKYVAKRVSVLLKEPRREQVWVLEEQMPLGGSSVLFGLPKAGKSTLVRQLAYAVARGDMFLDRATMKGPVIYVCAEKSEDIVFSHFQTKDNDEDVFFIYVKTDLVDIYKKVEANLIAHHPVLVIIDTLSTALTIENFNDNAEVVSKLSRLTNLARDHNTHICFVHHSNKSISNPYEPFPNMLGATTIRSITDANICFTREVTQDNISICKIISEVDGKPFPLTTLHYDMEQESYALGNTDAHNRANELRDKVIDFWKKEQKVSWTELGALNNRKKADIYKIVLSLIASGMGEIVIEQTTTKKGHKGKSNEWYEWIGVTDPFASSTHTGVYPTNTAASTSSAKAPSLTDTDNHEAWQRDLEGEEP